MSKLLRAADPGTVKRGDPLSERGLRELAEYEAREAALERAHRRNARRPASWRPRRPVRLATGGAFVVALLAAVFALTSVLSPAPAIAATPPLLALTPISAGAPELLKEMETMRRTHHEVSNTIRAQTWALNTTFAEDGTTESTVVEPQWSETTFLVDGSVHYRLVAAKPFPGQDDDSLPAPGTVLVDESFQPGEWDASIEDGPPLVVDEVGAYLATFAGGEELTAGQTLREISTIMSNYLLTPEQEAALIGHLSRVSNIQVSGSTIDRLGRAGIVFSATDRAPDEYEDRLIVSPRTGQILAAETLYTGRTRTDIQAPAVVDYAAWER
ncbi:hypothetical protein E4U02_11985 [Microbacterium paludicola]|uniref:CU044_5270 family protein n=1 Tax=Microbacterium paludicola TaxID=300019 RepID=A0A4Y9FT30_9MICO|nr:hypothetical protein [Microbacterium paludicola]MBF0817136.1 hypothetical protein [Microbacterium paludicola]TFU32130.1 hypothetical protein E4U02_11985 [Microbacterium paludicola]